MCAFSYLSSAEWPPIWEIAAHSAYDIFPKYTCMYLFDNLAFSPTGISFCLRHFLIIVYLYLSKVLINQ